MTSSPELFIIANNNMPTFNTEDFEHIPCAICGARDLSVFNISKSEQVHNQNVICETCGLVFITPRLKEERYIVYYKEEYVRDIYGVKSEKDVAEVLSWRGRRANDKIGYFPEYFSKYRRVLEIGAGTGIFLVKLREMFGADIFGVEPSTQFVSIAKKHLNIPLFEGTAKDYFARHGASRRFNMIVMDQVLEHVYDPLATLLIVHDLLECDGFAYIGVPNIANPAHPREEFFIGPHVYQFNPWSINKLLAMANLKMIKLHDPPSSPMHMIVARTDNSAGALSAIPGPFSKEYLTSVVDNFGKVGTTSHTSAQVVSAGT